VTQSRNQKKLSPLGIKSLTEPGRYNDGRGLYLHVRKSRPREIGGESTIYRAWVFRYRDRVTGKLRDKGLGPLSDVSLKEAREAARKCRNALRDRKDPIDIDRQQRIEEKQNHKERVTFNESAKRYIKAHRASWSNAKHAAQWTSTLETYAAPLHEIPVADIDTDLILSCLEPIWTEKTETATRVRQRIESVMDWATARKYRSGENPARWKGHLDKLLPKPSKLKKVKHHPALPYHQIGNFMFKLREVNTNAARALELQILTATRPGEVVGAKWEEFDLENARWIIPAERMKANKEHEIPLTIKAVAALQKIARLTAFVFPGVSDDKHLTTAAGMKLLKELKPGITAHGFRSTFRDWAGESTPHPREVIEHALAHQLKDKAEAAYARGTLLKKRKCLMSDWADYCDLESVPEGNVTPIRGESHG